MTIKLIVTVPLAQSLTDMQTRTWPYEYYDGFLCSPIYAK